MAPRNIPPRRRRRRLPLPCPESMNLDFQSVSFHGEHIVTLVAKKSAHVQMWVNFVHHVYGGAPQTLVGLDTEWLPNTFPGDDHPIATIQLCIGNHCIIYQVLHFDAIPESLQFFLADPHHVFCGVGVEGDVKKLYNDHGLRVRRYADLNDLRRMITGEDPNTYRYMGLKKMAMAVLGKEMKKPPEITMSKWDLVDLDSDQVEYAAIDAYVSFQLAFKLSALINEKNYYLHLM